VCWSSAVIEEQRAECRGFIADGVSCEVESGPYYGFTWGVAAAYIAQVVDGGAVRFELSFEYVRSRDRASMLQTPLVTK